ncbi:methyltransferase domain-containing protein [Piscinibacter sp. Jin2]|uniref:Methyltransferase domain-containing protein n=1 Tax=Aquariibacter lacus TaxID=2801332 RepID=A0A9X1BSJ4_9BURK|nr:methyltransferase domain-containing protein [Piscinibacter lacus]MBL0720693.1 methyltransferase domain-containing protein [Piscinibacter lacus]
MSPNPSPEETARVVERYARRPALDGRYSLLRPEVMHAVQERQRALAGLLREAARRDPRWADLTALRLTEVGCGNGGNLLELLRLGLRPEHLTALELLPERAASARDVLPAGLAVIEGDACIAPVEPGSQDLVLASTVFSSLLDAAFQQRLADAMWRWLRPGGAVLCYDFAFDNPRNPDVRGVPVARLRQLWPEARLSVRRVTLAPPLARRLPAPLLPLFNALPLLRTHRLVWLARPDLRGN